MAAYLLICGGGADTWSVFLLSSAAQCCPVLPSLTLTPEMDCYSLLTVLRTLALVQVTDTSDIGQGTGLHATLAPLSHQH